MASASATVNVKLSEAQNVVVGQIYFGGRGAEERVIRGLSSTWSILFLEEQNWLQNWVAKQIFKVWGLWVASGPKGCLDLLLAGLVRELTARWALYRASA